MKEQLPVEEQAPQPPWQTNIRAALDRQADAIDAATLSRLNRSRQAALAQLDTAPKNLWTSIWKHVWTPVWGGALATAAACVLVVVTLWPGANAELETLPDANATDNELLADQAEPEFFNELEFYSWLAEEGLAPQEAADEHEA